MIACPLCEHQQAAGSACEVCGRHLVEGRGTDAPVAPLEGLESTSQAAAAAGPVELVADLEPTRQAAVPAPAPEALPGMEPTRTAPVEVVADLVPDLERTLDGLPDDGPTPVAATVVCRYCRTEAAPGELRCGRCGMRLPAPAAARQGGPSGPARALCSCGTPVTRSICPACGARNASP